MLLKDILNKTTGKVRHTTGKHLCMLIFLFLTIACSSIDCPLNNLVYTNYALYDSYRNTDTLRDTLTVMINNAEGNDVIVLNRDVNITSFILPISYSHDSDEFYLEIRDTLHNIIFDTINVKKENIPHFESTDCAPSFFHKLTDVTYTRNAIDSVVINTPEVDYDTSKEHFRIYFKHRD